MSGNDCVKNGQSMQNPSKTSRFFSGKSNQVVHQEVVKPVEHHHKSTNRFKGSASVTHDKVAHNQIRFKNISNVKLESNVTPDLVKEPVNSKVKLFRIARN